MNRNAARTHALANRRTIGDLKQLIAAARDQQQRPSRIKPARSLQQVLDLFDICLRDRNDADVPVGSRVDPYSPHHRIILSADGMLIQSILRECA